MSDLQGKFQKAIRLGTHGEDYGSWMSNPVFYMVGGLTALAALLAVLSFAVFHIFVPGILFVIIVAGLLALLGWITWIRRQYAFDGGRIMERVHQAILSHIDYDGKGTLLAEVTGLAMDGDVKTVKTSRGELHCFGVLLATGAHPRSRYIFLHQSG